MNEKDIYDIYSATDGDFNCILGFSSLEPIKKVIGEEKINEAKNIILKRLEEIREDKSFSISSQQCELVKYFKDLLLSKKIDKKDDSIYGFYKDIEAFINQEEKIIQENQIIKLLPENLKQRYAELIKAINNNMTLSFFWLAGSIIEGVLCEYCEKNNIKSSKNDIDGYIATLEKIINFQQEAQFIQHYNILDNLETQFIQITKTIIL
jgi:hypothetical protein